MLSAVQELSCWRRLLTGTVLLCLLLVPFPTRSAPASTARVLFINPTWQGHPHWQRITDTMQMAAREFGLQLEVVYAGYEDRNKRLSYKDLVVKASLETPKPDYVVFMFYKSVGAETLAALEKARIHSFTINTPIPDNERQAIGLPQQRFKYWLGHIAPDDRIVGAQLAIAMQGLLAPQPPTQAPVQGIGLTGDWLSSVAQDRQSGFLSVTPASRVWIRQVVPAGWETDKARSKTQILLQRYPDSRFIWCASDTMALGAIDALKAMGRWQPKAYVIGGVDWTAQGLDAIARGELDASVGGHFLDGGWVMVMIYDHWHGVRLDKRKTLITSPMKTLTQDNVQPYRDKLKKWSQQTIRFLPFSLYYNGRNEYHFAIESLLAP